jgi:aconitate hydratase 2/2-methylisocitrate dehydratase
VSVQKEIVAMIATCRANAAELDLQRIPPKPLGARWTAGFDDLLKNPPADEEYFLIDLIANHMPLGVHEACLQ